MTREEIIKPRPRVRAYACRVSWAPQFGESRYNARSAGEAKALHYRHVKDAWPDTRYTEVRVRCAGEVHTSAQFSRVAQMRGMPQVRCGQVVKTTESEEGIIVGHNDSANFNVLFTTGRFKDQVCNVHPHSLTLLGERAPTP